MVSNRPSTEIAILDYGMGNLRSVLRAWEKVGAQAKIISEIAELDHAKALVFPGQGAIQDTIKLLKSSGWDDVIREWIAADKPFFGICLGFQALYEQSEEGNTPGLGIFKGEVRRFRFPMESHIKVPHMGWNDVTFRRNDSLKELSPAEAYYFVHSYYVYNEDPTISWGVTEYGNLQFCSAIQKGNLIATQFHPEKSQRVGLGLYSQFLNQIVRN